MTSAMIVAAACDKELTKQLLAQLSGGLEVSVAPEPPDLCNMDMRAAAVGAIKSAGAVILVVTEEALRSPFVRFSAESARRFGVPLIPVLFQPIEAGALLTLTGGADAVALEAPDEANIPDGERALGAFETRHAGDVAGILLRASGAAIPAKKSAAMADAPEEGGLDGLLDDDDFEEVDFSDDEEAPPEADIIAPVVVSKPGLGGAPPAPASAPAPAASDIPASDIPASDIPRADRRRERSAAPSAQAEPDTGGFRAAKLFENAPRRMRIGRTQEITVRIARDAKGGEGMSGSVNTHEILAAGAMTVTLDDPSFGYAIRPLTPATQWVDRAALASVGLGLERQPAEWRWSVEPLKTGQRPLVIRASARVTDPSGVSAEAGLPEQLVKIRVGVDPVRAAKDTARWILFAVAAGVLGHYGVEIIQTVNAFIG